LLTETVKEIIMALRKPTTTNTATFEQEPGAETAVAEHEVPQKGAAAPAPTVAARMESTEATTEVVTRKVESTVAIVRAETSSLSADEAARTAKRFKAEVAEMKGAADFGYGSHRVFKADNGVIKEMAGEKLVLGRWVKVRLLAWDTSFQVSPGEQGKDSGQFVAYSKDGVTIDFVIGEEQKGWVGKSVEDYVEHLRTVEEFDKASKREFIDTEVAVLGSEDAPEFRESVQITLSASSIPAFRKYQSDLEATAKCVQMGLEGYSLPADPFTLYMVREAASKGSQTWTKLKLMSTLPAKI
jgi:hypothetical protein